MDALVDEDDVVTSSGDRRASESPNGDVVACRKNLDRVSPVTSLSAIPVRTSNINRTVVFTSVPSPTASSGNTVKHGGTAIAVSQPGGGVSIVQLQLPNQTNVVQSVIQPAHQQSVIQATGGAATVQTVQIPKNVIFLNKLAQNSVIQSTENTAMNQVLISTIDRPEASPSLAQTSDHAATSLTSDSVITSPSRPQATSSIIASTSVTPVSSAEDESKKRREVLERRPSYRKILNELSSADVGAISSISNVKSEDENDSESSSATIVAGVASPYLKVVTAPTIQLAAASQDGTLQGLQTLTMTNATSGGNTIVQYATQGQDGQFFVPVTVSAADLQAYQIRTAGTGAASSIAQGVVMTAPATIATSHNQNAEDAAKKRELRLLKNREAAKECRRKKKEYIKCLEQRVNVLENQNKALIEELKTLKNLYCQKE